MKGIKSYGVTAITKTLLHAYKDLEEQCNVLDDLMLNCAISSANRGLEKSIDKIVAFRNEKIALINAKVLVDETLEKMERNISLKLVYIERTLKPNATSESQIEQFNALLFQTYGLNKLLDLISDSKFIMKIYRHYIRQEQGIKKGRGKNESN